MRMKSLPLALLALAACSGGGSNNKSTSDTLTFAGTVNPVPGFDFNTGPQPSSGPVEIDLSLSESGDVAVGAKALASGSGPTVTAVPGSGTLSMDLSFAFGGTLTANIPGVGAYDGGIPGLASLSIVIAGDAGFDPFLIGGSVPLTVNVPPTALPSIPLAAVGLPDTNLVIVVDSGSTLTTTFSGVCAAVTAGSSAEAHYTGQLTTQGVLELSPSVVANIPLVGAKSFGPSAAVPVNIGPFTVALDLGTVPAPTGGPAPSSGTSVASPGTCAAVPDGGEVVTDGGTSATSGTASTSGSGVAASTGGSGTGTTGGTTTGVGSSGTTGSAAGTAAGSTTGSTTGSTSGACSAPQTLSDCGEAAGVINTCCMGTQPTWTAETLCQALTSPGTAPDSACASFAGQTCADLEIAFNTPVDGNCCCPTGQNCDQVSGSCVTVCASSADCTSDNSTPACAPDGNAQLIEEGGTDGFICRPSDGVGYDGCGGANNECRSPFDCWTAPEGQFCTLSCNVDADCGNPGIACCDTSSAVSCSNFLGIHGCDTNPACTGGACAGACLPCGSF